eukprot:4848667-Lingulodinium_polyedra.AAC.1
MTSRCVWSTALAAGHAPGPRAPTNQINDATASLAFSTARAPRRLLERAALLLPRGGPTAPPT